MLAEKLAQFRSRLLDTSRRNRLLNFKPKGNRSVQLFGHSAGDLYQWLVDDKKSLDFLAREEWQGQESVSDSAAGASVDGQSQPSRPRTTDSDFPVKPMLAAPHGAAQTSNAGDAVAPSVAKPEDPLTVGDEPPAKAGQVLTYLPEEKIDARLLFLAREAESAMQEQGCNILYASFGLLDWQDPNERGGKPSAAPLVLVPVELVRKDVTHRYKLHAIDDEPIVNPTLIELCKSNFRLDLPAFNHEAAAPLDDFFQAIEERIAGPKFKGWSVRKEVHVGLFSFAKLLMYLDLHPDRWPEGQSIGEHPLVARLCGLAADDPTGGELQDQARIDDEVHPRDCFQVVDADSSQQVAILSAKRGASMVIEGPPGTGKSQTITNIIAECIAAGKTVLFVAEKAAALQVVKRNLDRVGLGEFALSMHSRQASKRAILDELDRALQFEYQGSLPQENDADELFRLRNRLNEYVRRLHERIAPLGLSRYEAMAACAKLRTAPETPFDLHDVAAWDSGRLADAEERVESFARAVSRVGDPSLHPWRGVGLTDVPLVVRQQLPLVLNGLANAVAETERAGQALASYLQSPVPRCRQDGQRLIDVTNAILQARTLDAACALQIHAEPPPDYREILDCGRRIAALRTDLRPRWQPSAETVDWGEIASRRRREGRSILRWLRRSWYRDSAAIRPHLVGATKAASAVVGDDLEKLTGLRALLTELGRLAPRAQELFGTVWRDDAEDWPAVEAHARAVDAIRQLIAQGQTSHDAIVQACGEGGRQQLKRLAKTFADAWGEMGKRYKELRLLVRLDSQTFLGGDPESAPFGAWRERLERGLAAIDSISDWADRARRGDECRKLGLGTFVDWCQAHARELGAEEQRDAFRRQFFRLWLDATAESWPDFRLQRGDDLQAVIDRFREADREWLRSSRGRLIAAADARRPQKGQAASKSSRLGMLEAEVRKKRGIKPIRKLFGQLGDVVLALKPCFMMSPMSAAQYLEPGKLWFDVVVFDEASQVEPADALGAIARARQVVLVGDEKQLPPTNFFGTINDADADDAAGDDDSLDTKDLESVLAMGAVCLRVKTTLRWHYRSQHSSLIEFSNDEFYDRQLRVFPSPEISRDERGLSFRHVADGVYFRGKGQYNQVEAREVAKAVIEHAQKYPRVSLGVGAFSMAQQRAIEDEIERLRRASSSGTALEEFFNRDTAEPFFVKNLETIQGDEREVIFLSVGYGPDENKRLTANFGPLNRDGGWRRLNVLVTRARCRCVVFSSFTADRLQLPPSAPRGVLALKDYLHFAEHGTLPTIQQYRADHESPFEADVCNELRQRGWTVHAQVGCAGFSIDLAVVDPKTPGRYLLGIECDGATYHSSATARDRDRLRQEVLENLRWRIYRIWSTDWFERRAETLDRLLRYVDDIANVPGAAQHSEPVAADTALQTPPSETADAASSGSPGNPASENIDLLSQRVDLPGTAAELVPAGTVPYCRFPASACGTSDQLLAMRDAEVTALLEKIVAIEGPIHIEELFRTVARMYHARVTGQAKAKLQKALQQGSANRRFVVRGKFAWPSGMDLPPVRWRGNEDAVTNAEFICPEEVVQAAVLLLQREFGIPLDDLPAATLRAMGFKRIGPQLAELGNTAIQTAIEAQRIRPDPSGFMVAATV